MINTLSVADGFLNTCMSALPGRKSNDFPSGFRRWADYTLKVIFDITISTSYTTEIS